MIQPLRVVTEGFLWWRWWRWCCAVGHPLLPQHTHTHSRERKMDCEGLENKKKEEELHAVGRGEENRTVSGGGCISSGVKQIYDRLVTPSLSLPLLVAMI